MERLTNTRWDFIGLSTDTKPTPAILSVVTRIGNAFMSGCYAFTQSLTVPVGVTSVDTNFMSNCRNFTSLVCNADPTNFTSSTSTLATTYASELKAKFPDQTTGSPYRKLIVAS